MHPITIDRNTRALGAPEGWDPERDGHCGILVIRDEQLSGGGNVMYSAWDLTLEERNQIANGAPIILRVAGTGHPPVMLMVGDGQ